MRSNCPCKGCENRSAFCHAECNLYTTWRQERTETHDKYMRDKEKQLQLDLRKKEAISKIFKNNSRRK